MLRWGLILISLLGLVGCGANLRPDATPASIESNYPTAEFFACGQHFHGLGICDVAPGTSLGSLQISLQTYYRGTVTIDSPDCDFEDAAAYENSEAVPIVLPGVATTNCTLGITMIPEYPNQQNQAVVVHGFRGYLRIRVLPENTQWQGFYSHIPSGQFKQLLLPFPALHTFQVAGCGINYTGVTDVVNGQTVIDLKKLGFQPVVNRCNVAGVIHGAGVGGQDYFFDWVIAVYDSNYIPLPPATMDLNAKQDTLSVTADPTVAVIALGDNYSINDTGSFNFDRTNTQTLRALTLEGRSFVADWSPVTLSWVTIGDNE
jgi:hypothetical protein